MKKNGYNIREECNYQKRKDMSLIDEGKQNLTRMSIDFYKLNKLNDFIGKNKEQSLYQWLMRKSVLGISLKTKTRILKRKCNCNLCHRKTGKITRQ